MAKPEKPEKPKRRSRVDDPLPDLPPAIDTPAMRDAWTRWLAARESMRKPVKAPGAAQCFADFQKWGIEAAIAQINKSIRCQYQGILEPDHYKGQAPAGTPGIGERGGPLMR